MKKCKMSLVLSCIIIFTFIFTGCRSNSVDEKKNESIQNVNRILIDKYSTDVDIISEDRKDVKVHLHGKEGGSHEHKLSVDLKDDILKIDVQMNSSIGVTYSDLKIDVYVPKNYKNAIEINSTSGDVNIKDMELNEVTIELTSGNTDIQDMHINNLNINSSSGNTNIKNLNVKEFEYDSSSGNLKGDKINSESVKYDTSSGMVKLYSFQGSIEGESTSGDVIIEYETFNNDVNLEASSGKIIVDLPDDAEFYLNAEASSGEINCGFPLNVESNKDNELKGIIVSNKNNINIKTTSGDVDIKAH